VIFLDAGVLGLLTNPNKHPNAIACKRWLDSTLERGTQVRVPEVADYELRRKLIHIRSRSAFERLNMLGEALGYVAITTAVMRMAADLWGEARQKGRPTAPDHALDGDVILAAQARIAGLGHDPVVATDNLRHLGDFVSARRWQDIA
jgi:predicted nucleic acid-binding protein